MNRTRSFMTNDKFFFDTYAFIEIIRGNPAYSNYKDCGAITTLFNIAELNYNLKKLFDKSTADHYTDLYSSFVVEIEISTVKEAMDFKLQNKKMSMADCIGYTVAKKYGIKILTGDNDFRNLSNVEFVK